MSSSAPPRTSVISRLALSTALLAATVVLISIVAFELIHGSLFRKAFEAPLQEWSGMMAGRLAENPDIAESVARYHRLGIVIQDGEKVLAYGPSGPVDPETLLNDDSGHRRIDVRAHLGFQVSFFFEPGEFSRQNFAILSALIVLLLAIIGITYVVQLSQIRPLQWLRNGVEAVSRGDFSTRVPVVRQDEIGQVGEAFNQMAERVEQMMTDRERLLADVSHELLSPMARIKVALELLPESEIREAIARDVREMESLSTVLLERERVGHRAERMHSESFDPVPLIEEVIRDFDGAAIELDAVEGDVTLQADKPLIKVLLHNLIDNAVKFSLPDSAPVRVRTESSPEWVCLIVDDDGPGLPADQAERVLEPFVKLNPARGHRAGYGLGLNLCQRIVRAHDGSIELHPGELRGLRVLVRLPVTTC